jgi:steroid delta-isomerase-like uncharacterized protein
MLAKRGIIFGKIRGAKTMETSGEENKQLIRRLYEEALHQGNFASIDEMFSPDFVDHSTPEQPAGPEGVKEYFADVREGFPDMRVTIDDLIAEGDRVVVRSTWRGTHLGTYDGMAATGKRAERTLIQIFRVKDGRILEEWNEGGGLLAAVQRDSL